MFFPASQDNCLVAARVGGTGSISLPAEAHEEFEEGRKGSCLGVMGWKYALSLQRLSGASSVFSHEGEQEGKGFGGGELSP